MLKKGELVVGDISTDRRVYLTPATFHGLLPDPGHFVTIYVFGRFRHHRDILSSHIEANSD
jgi:hypothetical protein